MSNSISSSTTRRLRVQRNDRRPRTPRGGLREGGWLRVKNRCSPRAAESPKSKGGELPPWFLLRGGHSVTPDCRACKVGPWRASLGAWKRHPTKPRRVELVRTIYCQQSVFDVAAFLAVSVTNSECSTCLVFVALATLASSSTILHATTAQLFCEIGNDPLDVNRKRLALILCPVSAAEKVFLSSSSSHSCLSKDTTYSMVEVTLVKSTFFRLRAIGSS